MRKVSKEKSFRWSSEESKSFHDTKNAIVSETATNGFYSLLDKTTLFTDAGPSAVGAVLTQTNAANKSRIIAFTSRSLSETEKNYSQIQKESLGVLWGVERFYYYLLGRPFIIKTDASGLTWIFKRPEGEGKRHTLRANSFALRLSPYDFEIEHISGKNNIADRRSNNPIGVSQRESTR